MTSDGTYKKKKRKGEAVNAQAAFMKAALNARPPKTLPKAKRKNQSFRKYSAHLEKGIDRVEKGEKYFPEQERKLNTLYSANNSISPRNPA